MHLSDEAIEQFRRLWESEHPGADISPEEVREQATRVLRAVAAVLHPIPIGKMDAFESLQLAEGGNSDEHRT